MKPYTHSLGRRYREIEDDIISDPFLNDYQKILQSKAYRRLADKTQVISDPDNSHVRTRLTHTNEVIAISLAIADKLGLNKNLCMAIAAGHDIGHTPYGHIGEKILTEFGGKEFKHNVFSVVIAQHIERKGKGLNLTYETLEGILNHSRGAGSLFTDESLPQEYSVVMFADKIAYTFSDLNDALRYGYLNENKIPDCAIKLGKNQRERVKKCVEALVDESLSKDKVSFSEGKTFELFDELRKFMYEEIYFKMDWSLQEKVLYNLCEFFSSCEDIKDPIIATSLLTDREANHFAEILFKSKKPSIDMIRNFGVFEILPYLIDKEIDYTDPDLNKDDFKW